jgi:hypothetical protein
MHFDDRLGDVSAMLQSLALSVVATAGCQGNRGKPAPSPAAWADVVKAAAPLPASGPPDELVAALAIIAQATLPSDLEPDDPAEATRVAGELPEQAFDAVEALVRWDQADGRLPPRTCKPSALPLGTIKLARVALLVAGDDADSPPVHAVLALAARHRDEGLSMLEGMIGSSRADATRRWAAARGLRAGAVASRYQPTDDGVRRIVAAEAVCSLSLVDELVLPEANVRSADGPLGQAAEVMTAAELKRIVAVDRVLLQRYWVELLADLKARPADPATIDRRITERGERIAKDVAGHPVLAMVAPMSARMIGRLRESDEAYRAWLAGAPPP